MVDKSSMTWLGIEDFFNYYLPGLLWFANIIAAIEVANLSMLQNILAELSKLDSVILVALAILIPYILGIIASSLGSEIHRIDKWLLGMPEEYVLNSKKKKGIWKIRFGSSLGQSLSRKIEKMATNKFGSDLSSSSLYFNVHYSLQFAPFPRVQSHIARITNLMNLNEGFISPILLGAILAFVSSNQLHIKELNVVGAILLILVVAVWSRYHYLRETRTKHVYRYFLLWQTIGQESDVK